MLFLALVPSPIGTLLVPKCSFDWKPFLELKNAHAVHFPSINAYDSFAGVGLGRTMHFSEEVAMPSVNSMQMDLLLPEGEVQLGSCVVAHGQYEWHTQRIGPFRSTGGFDYWQFSWSDVGSLGAVLDGLPPGARIGMTAHWSGPLDSAEAPLGLPPLHVHHIHVSPTSFEYENFRAGADCLLWGYACYDDATLMQHHGDKQCVTDEGGTDCFADDYSRTPKLVYGPIGIFAEFNDVRPASSPPMSWWYQFSMRIASPAETAAPISSHYLVNSGKFVVSGTATDAVGLIHVPSSVDSFHFYTGRMPFAGKLVFTKYHSHATVFHRSLLFAATTQQLGLDRNPFWMPASYQSVVTTCTGLANNSLLEAKLMSMLHSAQLLAHTSKHTSSAASHTSEHTSSATSSVSVDEPHLVCAATGRLERIGERWYDRQARIECAPWVFHQDDIFTVIQLNGPTAAAGGNGFEGMASVEAGQFNFRQHDNWILWYTADDGESHYITTSCSQTLDAISAWGVDRLLILRTEMTGGTPQSAMGAAERSIIAFKLLRVWLFSGARPATIVSLLILVMVPFGVVMFLRRFTRGRCSCGAVCLLVAIVLFEFYLFALGFYMYLPRDYWVNPQDEALLLARPASKYEQMTSAKAQLTASISIAALASAGLALWLSKLRLMNEKRTLV